MELCRIPYHLIAMKYMFLSHACGNDFEITSQTHRNSIQALGVALVATAHTETGIYDAEK